MCVCVRVCTQRVCVRLRACAWASGSTYGLLLCRSLQRCAMFFVIVFVSIVFCNSEVAKHPDKLLPVSMTTGQYLRRQFLAIIVW